MKRELLFIKRKTMHLSQKKIADKLGITQRAYSMIELNQINPSWEVAQRLENFFGIPASELLAEGEQEPVSR